MEFFDYIDYGVLFITYTGISLFLITLPISIVMFFSSDNPIEFIPLFSLYFFSAILTVLYTLFYKKKLIPFVFGSVFFVCAYIMSIAGVNVLIGYSLIEKNILEFASQIGIFGVFLGMLYALSFVVSKVFKTKITNFFVALATTFTVFVLFNFIGFFLQFISMPVTKLLLGPLVVPHLRFLFTDSLTIDKIVSLSPRKNK